MDYKPRTGYGCGMARNRIAADALNAGYDYVLMVDNDIALPQDALANLLEHGTGIVLGWYLNRYGKGEKRPTTLFKMGEGWKSYEAAELADLRDAGTHRVRVKGGGMGCALIQADVFEMLPFPWFEWTDESRDRLTVDSVYDCHDAFRSGGEDINFCNLASAFGLPIYADTRVACGHEFREVKWPG